MFTNDNLQRLLSKLERVRKSGAGWSARCPAHDDSRPSLTVSVGDDDRILLHCHKGCEAESIVAAIGMTLADLASHSQHNNKSQIVVAYDYKDESGELLFQTVRFEPKDFRQRQPIAQGEWKWSIQGVRRVLYRLPELLAADPTAFVFVVEGERDADRLTKLGLVATTNPMGAGKWRDDYAPFLCERKVVVLSDNDDKGREHAEDVARSVINTATSIRIIRLPGLPEKGDASDWLDAGSTREELLELAGETAKWQSDDDIKVSSEDRALTAYTAYDIQDDPWPEPIDEAAYCGVAGELVRIIEPHSEADPVAVLIQFLIAFGNVIGRIAHFCAEADKHFGNLFVCLVGRTAKGRKGVSWGQVARPFCEIDGEWRNERVMGGLSSGEGLIWSVRDPITKRQPIHEGKGKNRKIVDYETVEVDEGVVDKRLLVLESEFASVLKVAARERNTLTAIIRQSWDTGTLRILTKNSPAKSTAAHISVVGHITKDELRRQITDTDMANGFANRFLWVCVHRSKCLPEGGAVHTVDFSELIQEVKDAVNFAKNIQQIKHDDQARQIWHEVYPQLSEGKPGLLGAATSRAEAQVMRLAMLYALLDRSSRIRPEHLMAGLAIWQYAEQSARYIFGGALGDPTADEILRFLWAAHPEGQTRNDLREHFWRNKRAGEITNALRLLHEHRLARCEWKSDTGGRPAEKWFAVT